MGEVAAWLLLDVIGRGWTPPATVRCLAGPVIARASVGGGSSRVLRSAALLVTTMVALSHMAVGGVAARLLLDVIGRGWTPPAAMRCLDCPVIIRASVGAVPTR